MAARSSVIFMVDFPTRWPGGMAYIVHLSS
jgi:hypothetical protein